jgi:ubiquinone/menaquinone biosynthesis C-methylase UbiE
VNGKVIFILIKTLLSIGLRRGMRLVDLGCGYGIFSIPAAQIVGKRGSVYSIDIDRKMVEKVRKKARELKLTNVHARVGDISILEELLEILSESVDIVLLANIIHGTKRKVSLLKTLKKMLRPSGSIAIINWKLEKTPRGPPTRMRPTESKTSRYLVEAGYVRPRILDVPPYHYAATARLPKRKPSN